MGRMRKPGIPKKGSRHKTRTNSGKDPLQENFLTQGANVVKKYGLPMLAIAIAVGYVGYEPGQTSASIPTQSSLFGEGIQHAPEHVPLANRLEVEEPEETEIEKEEKEVVAEVNAAEKFGGNHEHEDQKEDGEMPSGEVKKKEGETGSGEVAQVQENLEEIKDPRLAAVDSKYGGNIEIRKVDEYGTGHVELLAKKKFDIGDVVLEEYWSASAEIVEIDTDGNNVYGQLQWRGGSKEEKANSLQQVLQLTGGTTELMGGQRDIAGIWNANAVDRGSNSMVFAAISRGNHHCDPNALIELTHQGTHGDDFKAMIKVIKPIKKDQPIHYTYVPFKTLLEPRAVRKTVLERQFGFKCMCSRCEGQVNKTAEQALSKRLQELEQEFMK